MLAFAEPGIEGAGNESCELLEPGEGTEAGLGVFFFELASTERIIGPGSMPPRSN